MVRDIERALLQLERLGAAIQSALGDEVAQEARECIRQAAQGIVYDAYTPIFLSRRGSSGGLMDERNMTSDVSGDTLTVRNETGLQNLYGGDDGSSLADIVEEGNAAYYMARPGPRPFDQGIVIQGKTPLRHGLWSATLVGRGRSPE